MSFNTVITKVDSLIDKHDSCNSIVKNIIVTSNPNTIDPWWLLSLEYLFAPAIIILISVWITNFTSRNREYKRIRKLNDFINVWLNNIILGLNEQIQLFRNLRETYTSIEFDNIRTFDFANVDISSILDIPRADLHKKFITMKTGNTVEKSQNFYDILFGLNSAKEIIEHFKIKSSELNQRTNQISDIGFNIFKRLISEEKKYMAHIYNMIEQNPSYKQTQQYSAFQSYMNLATARQKYFESEIGKQRTKRAIYYFSKKLIDVCNSNIHLEPMLNNLLETNNELILSISQLKEYYAKIRLTLSNKINETERMRDLISSRHNYFNGLRNVSVFGFDE